MPRAAVGGELLNCGCRRIRGGPVVKRLSLLAVLAMAGVIAVAMPAAAAPQERSAGPDPLPLPAGQEPVWKVVGEGVQIYDCEPSATDPTTKVWTFREPAAVLYQHGLPVGIHFRGPTFESFDGSSVVGALEASVPAPRPGAIPWLLLSAASTQGDGVLSSVDFIERVRTKGGVAPAGACDPAENSTLSVPYRAQYQFYAAAA
jgi:hypothetical protein